MITKIKTIQGIGVYHHCFAKGEGLDLKKNTVIYANNGYGKSTLVSVLRSFVENCPEIIEERKTIGENIGQFVAINVLGGTITFDNQGWKQNLNDRDCPPIIIFDEQFVQENLFVREIEAGHKKRIYQLVVGEEGRELTVCLNKAIQTESEKRTQYQLFEKELNTKNKAAEVEDYLKLDKDIREVAEQRIIEIEKQLMTIANSSEIKELLEFGTVEFIPIDVSDIKNLITKSFVDFHEEAKEKVYTHIKKNLKEDERTEEFVRLGTELQKTDCPYCGQSLENSIDLIKAYQAYFNETYAAFQISLKEKIDILENWDFRTEIEKLQRWINNCEKQIAALKRKAGEESELEIKELFCEYALGIEDVRKKTIDILRGKQLNLSNTYSDEIVNRLEKIFRDIDNELNEYRDYLDVIRTKYTYLVKNGLGKSLDDLKKEKEILEKRKNRFSDEERLWCENYLSAEYEAKKTEQDLEELVQTTNKYTRDIFKKFEKSVNKYLIKLRAQFQIGAVSSKTDKVSKEAYIDFNIVLRQQDVALKSRSKSPQPEFSNTLSNGDKNTLGLAFFFAWLEIQPDLEELIVVIDDPLTSMDDNRRLGTAQVLGEFSENVKQLLVLTHKKDFLFQLDDELPDLQALSIKYDEKNGSEIVPFDIKNQRKDKHYQRIDGMIRYCKEDFGPSVQEMQENIRKVIEKVLKIKYYPELEGFQTLSPMLDYLAENQYLDQDIIEKLRKLKNISSPVHHAEETGRPIQNLERPDIIPEIEATLKIKCI